MNKKKRYSAKALMIIVPITAIITVACIFGGVAFMKNAGQSDVDDLLDNFENEFAETTPFMPELEDGTEDDYVEINKPIIDNSNSTNSTSPGINNSQNTQIEVEPPKQETQEPNIDIKEPEEKDYKEYSNTIGIMEIPSIKVKAPIALGTSNKIINKQIGQYKTTDPLGQIGGSTGFAAHSGERGWNCWYCYFNNIGKLKEGAEIIIKWHDGKTYTYSVTEVKTKQNPKEPFVYEKNENESRITLTTCTNGNAKYRTFVRAVLQTTK